MRGKHIHLALLTPYSVKRADTSSTEALLLAKGENQPSWPTRISVGLQAVSLTSLSRSHLGSSASFLKGPSWLKHWTSLIPLYKIYFGVGAPW